jgi:thioredoxin-like negative regulator of GroEL
VSRLEGRWVLAAVLAFSALGLFWGGFRWLAVRRHRRAIAGIQAEIEQGRTATAARSLAALLAQDPDSDEAAYLLGTCEMAQGRSRAAAAVWARIKPDSEFAARALLGRMGVELDQGRLAAAEKLIKTAMADPGADGSSLCILLGPVYSQQGRVDEAKRLIESRWADLNAKGEGAREAAINLVRLHIALTLTAAPVEGIRAFLDEAAQLSPEDDRVLLGKANLAIRTASYGEAGRLLDLCLSRRPDDVAVWRARLDWAMATDHRALVHRALAKLPAEGFTPAQLSSLTAWFARARGDREAEVRALERTIAADPGDFATIDRLITLLAQQGNAARAEELRRQKAETETVKARYEKLYARNQPARDGAEMGRLAVELGRTFEARVFLTVALAADPDREDLRRDLSVIERGARVEGSTGRTVADVLGQELEGVAEARRRQP